MQLKFTVFFLIGCAIAADPTQNESRDLAADIRIAQQELSSFIKEALKFSSTFQLILNADILLEVNNNFHQIYSLMQNIGVQQETIEQIRASGEQDKAVISTATDNLEYANLDMINGAYVINSNLRNGSLTDVRSNYDIWVGEFLPLFNQRYQQFNAALSLTGNSIELQVVSAITGLEGAEVNAIYAYLQKTNDRINEDAELMQRELIVYDRVLTTALNAVQLVLSQA
ncbi:uncharacterized protein LOC135948566 [Cloeon dipterum]|uniref:uncharacterized protein LOC135948566 n=1 Tax=Cloeon dipterum TaxID=197152 RepID=UPI0032207F44